MHGIWQRECQSDRQCRQIRHGRSLCPRPAPCPPDPPASFKLLPSGLCKPMSCLAQQYYSLTEQYYSLKLQPYRHGLALGFSINHRIIDTREPRVRGPQPAKADGTTTTSIRGAQGNAAGRGRRLTTVFDMTEYTLECKGILHAHHVVTGTYRHNDTGTEK